MAEDVWGDPPGDAYLANVATLFASAGRDKPVDLLRWQYLDGVAGPAVARAIADGEQQVFKAHYAVVPRRLWLNAHEVPSAQSLDVMTAPEWQGRGLYLRLAPKVYERLSAAGTAVVYGFPNDEASAGFFGPLGWERLGRVPLVFRPLPSGLLAEKGPRRRTTLGPHVRELDEVPEQVEELWRRVAPQLRVSVVRDLAFLRWRLDERPGVDYVRLAAFDRGRLVGFAALGLAERAGRPVCHVLELLVDPTADRMGRRLLRAVLRTAASRGAVVALAWSPRSSPTHGQFRGAGFRSVPRSLQPVGVHVGVRVFDRRRRELLDCLDPTAWYLSYLDSDTV